MWGIPVSFQCGIGIFRFLPLMASGSVGFPIRNYGGRAGCKRRGLGCGGKHTAAFRDLCQIGYSVSFPPATFALWHFRPPFPCIVKTSRSWKPQGFKQKGKD